MPSHQQSSDTYDVGQVRPSQTARRQGARTQMRTQTHTHTYAEVRRFWLCVYVCVSVFDRAPVCREVDDQLSTFTVRGSVSPAFSQVYKLLHEGVTGRVHRKCLDETFQVVVKTRTGLELSAKLFVRTSRTACDSSKWPLQCSSENGKTWRVFRGFFNMVSNLPSHQPGMDAVLTENQSFK